MSADRTDVGPALSAGSAGAHSRCASTSGWDFRGADTKEFTHCLHAYPAMMIPQIARELLVRYGREGGWLLDPYCGTGTSLVEASVAGMNAVGCDVNPLVCMIASAKTTPIPADLLEPHLQGLSDRLLDVNMGASPPSEADVDFPNRDFWFSKPVSRRLATLRAQIEVVDRGDVRNFLWTAFSETVRDCSYTRNTEFKLYRMPSEKLAAFDPDVFAVFWAKIARNRRGMAAYVEKRACVQARVLAVNTAEGEVPDDPPAGGFDLVITSPPYGDSQTTVAYGQYSRLSSEWIGLREPRTVDRRSMGGALRRELDDLGPVQEAADDVRRVDEKRARQVSAFYADLAASIVTVAGLLGDSATACYVVGNRRVKGVTLPTDAFVAWVFEARGFRHVETIVRNIPNKRMPSKNSPSNVAGRTDVTMQEESVVILRR